MLKLKTKKKNFYAFTDFLYLATHVLIFKVIMHFSHVNKGQNDSRQENSFEENIDINLKLICLHYRQMENKIHRLLKSFEDSLLDKHVLQFFTESRVTPHYHYLSLFGAFI